MTREGGKLQRTCDSLIAIMYSTATVCIFIVFYVIFHFQSLMNVDYYPASLIVAELVIVWKASKISKGIELGGEKSQLLQHTSISSTHSHCFKQFSLLFYRKIIIRMKYFWNNLWHLINKQCKVAPVLFRVWDFTQMYLVCC